MTPTTPRVSRNASSSSPITVIFFGGPSASGNSSDNSTGSQNRRSNSPIGVPAPLSVRNLLSSARSIGFPPEPLIAFGEPGAAAAERQRKDRNRSRRGWPLEMEIYTQCVTVYVGGQRPNRWVNTKILARSSRDRKSVV